MRGGNYPFRRYLWEKIEEREIFFIKFILTEYVSLNIMEMMFYYGLSSKILYFAGLFKNIREKEG